MKAMILAAGRGRGMIPLTDTMPKPLLRVGGKALIQRQVEKLAAAGFRQLVVNLWYLGEMIEAFLGDGNRWGCEISYSWEEQPLETAGGIQRALPLLGPGPFAVVNGDIWTSYDLGQLLRHELTAGCLAHLVMVDNPPHHRRGDFHLPEDGRLRTRGENGPDTLTFSGMAVYHPDFFAGAAPGRRRLLEPLQEHMALRQVSGEHFRGKWEDVGTPQRLAALDAELSKR